MTKPMIDTHAKAQESIAALKATISQLTTAVNELEATFSDKGTVQNDADIAEQLQIPLFASSKAATQVNAIRAVAEQLVTLTQPPRQRAFEAAAGFYTSVALEVVIKSNVPSLIESEEKVKGNVGISSERLAELTKLDADLLARVLRLLVSHGLFQEVSSNTFTNSPASATMANNPEFVADLNIVLQNGPIATPRLHEWMGKIFESQRSKDEKAPSSAFEVATGLPFYRWLQQPEQQKRVHIFQSAMRGRTQTEGLAFLSSDFPLDQLPADSTIVDVGGGTGAMASLLLPQNPYLRFLIQEAPHIVEAASKTADTQMKAWIDSGRVRFEVQDMFKPQPDSTHGCVFLLKNIFHNYDDEKSTQLLRLIAAAFPSLVLIIDRLITPSCKGTEQPLTSQRIPTAFDIAMAALHGGKTRTRDEWKALFTQGGFHLERESPLRASMGQAVFALRLQ